MQLYSYYRSTAAYRVRIALNLLGLKHEIIPVNLVNAAHKQADYLTHNPQARVPTLVDGKFELGQSLAILEYLQEQYAQQTQLLPEETKARAWSRYIANIIACDMHPLNNLSTLKFLESAFNCTKEDTTTTWYFHWLKTGFDSLETLIANSDYTGKCCIGNTPSFADICLIPQLYNAKRFTFSLDEYPTLCAIDNHCLSLPAFTQAIPEKQIDCPEQAGLYP